ncbi:MAG TPA: MFS transporter [Tepidisphaeraceae bacterium]|nr:MFS transporter [Tepidisphaeraceae bacterium]
MPDPQPPQPPDPEGRPLQEPTDIDRPASASPTEPEMEAEAIGVAHDPYAALRYRDARLYMGGALLEIVGSQIQTVALMWELFQRTGSPLTLGWVGGVQAIPMLLLTLPAGYLADIVSRRLLVVVSQVGQVAASLWLAYLSWHTGSVALMLTAIGLGAIFQALGSPARSAMLPSLVPPSVFPNAKAWSSSSFQVASVGGPALGAFVLSMLGAPWAYVTAAVFSLIYAINTMQVNPRPFDRGVREPMMKSLSEGLRFVWNTKIILATITLDLFAVLLGGAVYLLPIFASERLHVGEYGFAFLRAAPAVGAFVTAMIIAHTPPFKRAGRAMLLAVAGFGAATIVFGLSTNYWLSLAMIALTGAFDNVSVVVRHTLVQVMTPDRMRGRVSAVNNVFIGASNEIGGFESGVTAAWLGAVRSVVFGGIGTILVVAAVAMKWPQVRNFGSLKDAKPAQ